MSKKKKMDMDINWYDVWMKQTKNFIENADIDVFKSDPGQMQKWMESFKNNWQFSEQQKAHEHYGKMMTKMSMAAADLMMKECMQRVKDGKPVNSARELYEIWLNCCHKVYADEMHGASWQDTYGECMNAAIHYWKGVLQK